MPILDEANRAASAGPPDAPTPSRAGARFAQPPWDRQSPPWLDIDRRLPADHLARRIDRLVDQLDLTGLLAGYSGTGSLAHRPELLLKVALYACWRGRRRPADWHHDAAEQEPARWLALGCRPSRSRWYAFRDRLERHLPDWNRQLLRQALAEGLTPAELAALDGSDLAANASRHRLVNAATLAQRLRLLGEAIAADGAGQAPAAVPGWMAKRPAGRRRQRDGYRRAEVYLDERRRRNRLRRKEDRRPDERIAISPSDPEAALGLDKLKVYRPLYNAQLCVDVGSPLILAYEVYAQPTDAGALGPMLLRLRWFLGRAVPHLLADAKYAAGPQLALAEQEGVAVYSPWQAKGPDAKPGRQASEQIPKSAFRWHAGPQTYECPQGHLLRFVGRQRRRRDGIESERLVYRCAAEHCRGCPLRAGCAKGKRGRTINRSPYEEQVERLRERMATGQGRALYRLRAQTVERGFADVKEHRGLRRLSGRGLLRARVELGLVVLAHNLLAVESLRVRRSGSAPLGRRTHSGG